MIKCFYKNEQYIFAKEVSIVYRRVFTTFDWIVWHWGQRPDFSLPATSAVKGVLHRRTDKITGIEPFQQINGDTMEETVVYMRGISCIFLIVLI